MANKMMKKGGYIVNRVDYTNQKFGKLLVKEMLYGYKNKQTYAKCQCDCGKETIAYMRNIRSGKTQSCGCNEIQSRYNRQNHEKNLHGIKFGHLKVIEKTNIRYSNGTVGWLCQCDCGNQIIVRSGSLLSGHTRSCGCNKRSKYEEYIEQYLKNNNIPFETEYRFKDCKNHFPLPFDFYIKNYHNKNYCIEFQGQHHYEIINSWGGEEKYQTIQINDNIKKQYCQNNSIVLICLPYTLSKQEIKDKLDNILEPVTTTVI